MIPHHMAELSKKTANSKKLSNLLQKMKKDGLVDVRGIAVNSEWYIKTKD